MNKQVALTVKEALKKGYTHCTTSDGEPTYLAIGEAFDEKVSNSALPFMIIEKEQTPLQFSDDEIKDMVIEHLETQDDVYDEGDEMITNVSEVDFSDITDKVNKALAFVLFYRSSNIILIP